MRHLRLFSALASIVFVTTGCGPDSPSDSNKALNPASSVSLTFETFTIDNEEGLPEVLPNTIFYDFYRGLEPADSAEDDKNTAAAVRGRIDELMGLTPTDDGTSYKAARNPMDFLNFVIDSNQVTTFNEGRQLMRNSISDGNPARYNTSANNATIRFTEAEDGSNSEPTTDQRWVYPLLDWTSAPLTGTILTARQFIARTPEDESETPPDVKSIVWSARFNAPEFSVSGYNQPEFELFSQTTRTLGNGELQKEHIGRKRDTFFLLNPPPERGAGEDAPQCDSIPPEAPLGITIAGENPDCIRVEVDYEKSEVRVFTSVGEAREFEDERCSLNTNFCGLQRSVDDAEAVIYKSVTIGSRQ
jgi:hypothetical protein